MLSPPKTNGDAGAITPERRPVVCQPPSSGNITATTVQGSVIAVTGVSYPPAARRTRWLTVVEHCPHCRGAHVHRGDPDGPADGPRKAGCGLGPYNLIPQTRAESAA
jgi:hypothetical protein